MQARAPLAHGLCALALCAASASAQGLPHSGAVQIDVIVQPIAELQVIAAEGEMLIDDASFTFMGLPSSEGDITNITVGSLAQMRILTNFCLNFVVLEFPRATGFRNTLPGTHLGVATGVETGRTLGVWPQAHWVRVSDGFLHQPGFIHDGGDTELVVRGPDGVDDQFCNGIHDLGLGVATDYGTSLETEPEFVAPDTYLIPITGTLVP